MPLISLERASKRVREDRRCRHGGYQLPGLGLLVLRHRDGENKVPCVSARDLLGVADADQLSIDKDPEPVAQHLGLLHAVRCQDESTALLVVFHDLPETTTARWVKTLSDSDRQLTY